MNAPCTLCLSQRLLSSINRRYLGQPSRGLLTGRSQHVMAGLRHGDVAPRDQGTDAFAHSYRRKPRIRHNGFYGDWPATLRRQTTQHSYRLRR